MTSIKIIKGNGRWDLADSTTSTDGFQEDDLASHRVCFEKIKRRNLIFHVAPFRKSEGWLRNLRQIIRRIDLFNGRRVAAIVHGEEMVESSCVTSVLGEYGFEYVFKPNSRRLRERQTFSELMQAVESTDPEEATFYAHSKGVASPGQSCRRDVLAECNVSHAVGQLGNCS